MLIYWSVLQYNPYTANNIDQQPILINIIDCVWTLYSEDDPVMIYFIDHSLLREEVIKNSSKLIYKD